MTRRERRAAIATHGILEIAKSPTGEDLLVVRPKNPALALAIARVAVDKNDADLFQRLPSEVGEYTFVGYLAYGKGGTPFAINENGAILDRIEPGDSFITPPTEPAAGEA